jgi:hypothetical protein
MFWKNIPLTRLSKTSTIGIDWQQFDSNFKIVDNDITASYPIIHSGNEELKTHMLSQSNKFIIPINEKAEKFLETKASYLLIPDRIRVTTSHVVPISVPLKVLFNSLLQRVYKLWICKQDMIRTAVCAAVRAFH